MIFIKIPVHKSISSTHTPGQFNHGSVSELSISCWLHHDPPLHVSHHRLDCTGIFFLTRAVAVCLFPLLSPQNLIWKCGSGIKSPEKKNSSIFFSIATLFRFVVRFARVRIEDSSRNRFTLSGIQSDFFGGILSGYRQFDINAGHVYVTDLVPNSTGAISDQDWSKAALIAAPLLLSYCLHSSPLSDIFKIQCVY